MSDLKTQLIKLGSTNPELRPHIRPLLEKFASRKILASEEVVVGLNVRITWEKSKQRRLIIQELPSKGKRLLRRITYYPLSMDLDEPLLYPMYLNHDAKFRSNMTYDIAVNSFFSALEKAKNFLLERGALDLNIWKNYEKKSLHYDNIPYLEVEPADYTPITVKGKDFTLKSEWDKFSQSTNYSDAGEMDPSYSGLVSKTKASARKLFKILKANPDALRNLTYEDFLQWLNANRIAYDTYSSSWR